VTVDFDGALVMLGIAARHKPRVNALAAKLRSSDGCCEICGDPATTILLRGATADSSADLNVAMPAGANAAALVEALDFYRTAGNTGTRVSITEVCDQCRDL
jgi:hypothetical protein